MEPLAFGGQEIRLLLRGIPRTNRNPMDSSTPGSPWRVALIAGAIASVSLLHYSTSTAHPYHGFHAVYDRLYYLPIVLAAFWYGFKGGVVCAVVISLAYIPHVALQWGGKFLTDNLHMTLEIVLYNVIGAVTGFLAQRLMNARTRYQRAAEELEKSYSLLQQQSDMLRQREEELRRADRLSALGELSAGLAHEIRNPLASIKGTAEIISDRFKPHEREHEFTQILIKEVNRLNTVLAEFLDFARPRAPRLVPSDLNGTVESVLLLTERQMREHGIAVEKRLAHGLPPIQVDPEQIKQVLLNLILNAVDAMPMGGTLTVETTATNDAVACRLSDTGKGIKREDMTKVFNPFFTTKPAGTGLGLSIAHRILEGHKGRIEVFSREGRGATFTITLPVGSEGTREKPNDTSGR